ncbi:MAG TPA: hypothetical protein VNU47_03010 [Candidatus Paceibacterota bacterium]|nr:hypothetical protein [Candidatus Paceibacterota bacterium]
MTNEPQNDDVVVPETTDTEVTAAPEAPEETTEEEAQPATEAPAE